jgi:hypothetical protein
MFCARPANYSPRYEDCPLAVYHSNTLLPHHEIHDPVDDSPVGHHIRNTVEFVAEMEREAIRGRMMGGKRVASTPARSTTGDFHPMATASAMRQTVGV